MRLVIVDDHTMFLELLAKACREQFCHDVVGTARTGADALRAVVALSPEILLLDLRLPDMDGLDVAARVLQENRQVRILAVSCHCEAYTLYRVEKLGIHGFVDKNTNIIAALGEALAALGSGRPFYSSLFQEVRRKHVENPTHFTKYLTERECQILTFIGQGLSDEEIGRLHLGISERTVQAHRSRLLVKLGIENTPKLVAFAFEHGFTHAKEGPFE